MLTLLKLLRNLYKVVVSETAPLAIASGFVAGMILGLTPLLSFHNLLLLSVVLMLRVNLSAVLLGLAAFKLLTPLLWTPFHAMGTRLLEGPSLQGFWVAVNDAPILSLCNLNNTQVVGSLTACLALSIPVLVGSLLLVNWARKVLTEARKDHWLVKKVNSSRVLVWLIKLATSEAR